MQQTRDQAFAIDNKECEWREGNNYDTGNGRNYIEGVNQFIVQPVDGPHHASSFTLVKVLADRFFMDGSAKLQNMQPLNRPSR